MNRGADQGLRSDAGTALSTASPPRFWNVPNTLTVGRLLVATVVFVLIAHDRYALSLAAFIVAALSDALDGYFARLLGQDTPIGRQLDPLIDKVIVSGCYIYLAAIPGTGVFPWMVTAIVVRELLIQGLRSLLEGQGKAFGAKMAGKLKTTAQCVSISVALLALSLSSSPGWLLWVRDILTWLAVALTIYSGASYLVGAMPALRCQATRD
jgi:CDP-diacylglycerol--glycerol-3-phosphate 3-phosphatidyltransferase